jgi:hypothetical protein
MEKDIVRLFKEELVPVKDLAKRYKCSRQQIYNILKSQKVDTSKTVRIERTCPVCDKKILIRKCLARRTKHSFCSQDCWWIYFAVDKEKYKESRVYSRLALSEIKIHFPDVDIEKHSIHYKDSDTTHFNANNFMIFENEKEHLRFHKGHKVIPLWGK